MIIQDGFVLRRLSTGLYVRSVTHSTVKFTPDVAMALRFKTPEGGLSFEEYLFHDWLIDDIEVIDLD